MDDLALEGVETRDVRQAGVGEVPGARDQPASRVGPARSPHRPPLGLGVPARFEHVRPEAQVRGEALVLGEANEVVLDLRARRVEARPLRVRREREAVEVARDVARGARVGVVPPGPADLLGAVQDEEVLAAVTPQLGAHAEAGESGADDEDLGGLVARCGAHVGGGGRGGGHGWPLSQAWVSGMIAPAGWRSGSRRCRSTICMSSAGRSRKKAWPLVMVVSRASSMMPSSSYW